MDISVVPMLSPASVNVRIHSSAFSSKWFTLSGKKTSIAFFLRSSIVAFKAKWINLNPPPFFYGKFPTLFSTLFTRRFCWSRRQAFFNFLLDSFSYYIFIVTYTEEMCNKFEIIHNVSPKIKKFDPLAHIRKHSRHWSKIPKKPEGNRIFLSLPIGWYHIRTIS